jgi:hypothetical protein
VDQRTRDEIQEALRSADRALRLAEKALLRVPVDAPESETEGPAADPAEQALSDFLFGAVEQAKVFEEQDPQSFKARVVPMLDDLLRFVLSKQMYQAGPRGDGTTNLDTTTATQTYEKCLRACTENSLNHTEVMTPFVQGATLKNWGDVDVDIDLVIMRYETPGHVTAHVDEAELAALVEAARTVAGAVDRIQTALREQGIDWKVSNDSGQLITELHVSGPKGQWAATIPTGDVVTAIFNRLSVVEVDYDNPQEGWWDAARTDHDLPQQLLPIVRGKESSIICHRSDIAKIEGWAANLPGWADGTETSPTPLILRDAHEVDILG